MGVHLALSRYIFCVWPIRLWIGIIKQPVSRIQESCYIHGRLDFPFRTAHVARLCDMCRAENGKSYRSSVYHALFRLKRSRKIHFRTSVPSMRCKAPAREGNFICQICSQNFLLRRLRFETVLNLFSTFLSRTFSLSQTVILYTHRLQANLSK